MRCRKSTRADTHTAWHQRGGVVGRGVLLDYKAWAEATGKKYSVFESHRIPVEDLEAVARHQGTEFRHGDILLVRVGLTEALAPLSEQEQTDALHPRKLCGLEGSEKMARWIWNHHFAAVAVDNLACEAQPPESGKALGKSSFLVDRATLTRGPVLHQYLLAMLGVPIGELWDLKALSAKCAELKRWSFFITSIPVNISSSIASPPNALAVF